jgi:hypothetical protein
MCGSAIEVFSTTGLAPSAPPTSSTTTAATVAIVRKVSQTVQYFLRLKSSHSIFDPSESCWFVVTCLVVRPPRWRGWLPHQGTPRLLWEAATTMRVMAIPQHPWATLELVTNVGETRLAEEVCCSAIEILLLTSLSRSSPTHTTFTQRLAHSITCTVDL